MKSVIVLIMLVLFLGCSESKNPVSNEPSFDPDNIVLMAKYTRNPSSDEYYIFNVHYKMNGDTTGTALSYNVGLSDTNCTYIYEVQDYTQYDSLFIHMHSSDGDTNFLFPVAFQDLGENNYLLVVEN